MTTTGARCLRCGYLTSRCVCPQAPQPPPPPVPAAAAGPLPELRTPAEVAALFRVDPKTVTKWAQEGRLRSIRTLGGHRRYPAAEIRAWLHPDQQLPPPLTGRQEGPSPGMQANRQGKIRAPAPG